MPHLRTPPSVVRKPPHRSRPAALGDNTGSDIKHRNLVPRPTLATNFDSNHDSQRVCRFFPRTYEASIVDPSRCRLWKRVHEATDGRYVSLATLSAECFAEKKRPLRMAIDTPLAVFELKTAIAAANQNLRQQNINGEGMSGMNHIVRDFYYQALHLLAAGVEPIFVFDGPQKPMEKGVAHPAHVQPCVHVASFQSGNSGLPGASIGNARASGSRDMATRLCEANLSHVLPLCRAVLDLLGLPHREAPAESEAECVRLEKEGKVDAILTRDGDAFIFGGQRVIRKERAIDQQAMSREFKMEDLKRAMPGLQEQNLFLVAMLSGGDYDPGITGCGGKVAFEVVCHSMWFAGRIGAIFNSPNPDPLRAKWKKELADELTNNTKGKFSQKWAAVARAINTNTNFPSATIAKHYREPRVSPNLAELKIKCDTRVDIMGLRGFTEHFFDWRFRLYSGKFVRTLFLPLLVRELVIHGEKGQDGSFLIASITKSRPMALAEDNGKKSNPGHPEELRVGVVPFTIVGIDISKEVINPGYKSNLKEYEGFKDEQLVWVPKWLVEYGAAEAFQKWELSQGQAAKGKKTVGASGQPAVKRPRGRPRKDAGQIKETSEGPAPKRPRSGSRKDASQMGTKQQTEGTAPKRAQQEVIEISDSEDDDVPDLGLRSS